MLSDPPLRGASRALIPGSRVQNLALVRLLSLFYGTPEAIPLYGDQPPSQQPAANHGACHASVACWCSLVGDRCPLFAISDSGDDELEVRYGDEADPLYVLETPQLRGLLKTLEGREDADEDEDQDEDEIEDECENGDQNEVEVGDAGKDVDPEEEAETDDADGDEDQDEIEDQDMAEVGRKFGDVYQGTRLHIGLRAKPRTRMRLTSRTWAKMGIRMRVRLSTGARIKTELKLMGRKLEQKLKAEVQRDLGMQVVERKLKGKLKAEMQRDLLAKEMNKIVMMMERKLEGKLRAAVQRDPEMQMAMGMKMM
jgi:hypothetical protein